jgi:hypothetical protein
MNKLSDHLPKTNNIELLDVVIEEMFDAKTDEQSFDITFSIKGYRHARLLNKLLEDNKNNLKLDYINFNTGGCSYEQSAQLSISVSTKHEEGITGTLLTPHGKDMQAMQEDIKDIGRELADLRQRLMHSICKEDKTILDHMMSSLRTLMIGEYKGGKQ